MHAKAKQSIWFSRYLLERVVGELFYWGACEASCYNI